jgi:hypothetical protein
MKNLIFTLIAVFFLSAVTEGQGNRKELRKARNQAKAEEVKNFIDNRNFEFCAQTANPMGGGLIQLTGANTLDILNDSVNAYLPYYGVAYYAEYGGGEGGIKFGGKPESSNWKTSRNGYDILMKFRTSKDLYDLHLFVSSNGYASLQVACINRQPISFSGYIRDIPAK